MTHDTTIWSRLVSKAAAAVIAGGALTGAAVARQDAPPAPDEPQPLTLNEWSQGIWQAAVKGDETALESFLSLSPAGAAGDAASALLEGRELFNENLAAAATKRAEERATALEELETNLESGDVLAALRSAVTYQTFSEDYDAALEESIVQDTIRRADAMIEPALQEGNWLLAQELLFRLRTLYDDTTSRSGYDRYDAILKDVNRHVTYLAQYAPERLHELRQQHAERMGEDPLPEYNPTGIEDWRGRLKGVSLTDLRTALAITAREHIEATDGEGWRPVLQGGLEALKTFVSTDGLEEAFPTLRDESATDTFVDFLDQQLRALERTPDADISGRYLFELLHSVDRLNRETVQLPEEVVYHEFGDGAMYELSVAKEDDYTEIIWPDELRRFKQSTEGSFVGVGILISYNDKREIMVVNPLEGTPAFRAGVRPDDVIVSVDGKSTVGWSLNDAVDRITGPRGTEVTLTVQRDDEEKTFTMERDEIKLHSVNGWRKIGLDDRGDPLWDWFVDERNRIAYVRLTGFSGDTARDLRRAWREMSASGEVRGLILDLRHNPGGLLTAAVDVSNLFVPDGRIVSIEDKYQRVTESHRADPEEAVIANADVPVVVLVNKGSASASEIVAGALQAHDAAVIVGQRTWGKGSVQRVYRLSPNAELKVTTQYYRLPPGPGQSRGRIVHKRPNATVWGVDPDIEVEMTPQQVVDAVELRTKADVISNDAEGHVATAEETRPDPIELIEKGLDPQLQTALLILQARAVNSDLRRAAAD